MTYGQNTAALRDGLAELLRQHRVQQRLGGPGPRAPATTSPAERAELGSAMQSYRRSVLTWCHQSAISVDPFSDTDIGPRSNNPFAATGREPRPIDALTRALADALTHSAVQLPSLAELTTPRPTALVEAWRQLARSAALAEHDVHDAVRRPPGLTLQQAQAVVADVAAIAQGLVVLDRRYRTIPGWRPLRHGDRLGWAALACAYDAHLEGPDYAIDERGWRPPAKLIDGAARPGILGVLQAEHNLALRLRSEPTVLNLRLVADSQRLLSTGLAERAARSDERLPSSWHRRADVYSALLRELRDIGSLTGRGGLAAAEGANAVSRLRAVPMQARIRPRVLGGFATLFASVDNRIADLIEDGLATGRYLERASREAARQAPEPAPVPGPVFVPVSPSTRARLQAISRTGLRTTTTGPQTPATSERSRAELHAALVHRPGPGSGARQAHRQSSLAARHQGSVGNDPLHMA